MYMCFYITKVYRKSNRREEKRNSKGARWIIPRQPAARLRSENVENNEVTLPYNDKMCIIYICILHIELSCGHVYHNNIPVIRLIPRAEYGALTFLQGNPINIPRQIHRN